MSQLNQFSGNLAIPIDGRLGFGRPGVVGDEPTGPTIFVTQGNPNGVVTAPNGSFVLDEVTPTIWQNTGGTSWIDQGSPETSRSYFFKTRQVGSGTHYLAGFYQAPAADVNLSQASSTVNFGAVNASHGAHAFLVGGGAGAAAGGSGAVEIKVSGTSFSDAGVLIPGDTEIIVSDVTTMSLDGYAETTKKWVGQITYTIQNAVDSTQITFNADFNYGFAKYDDLGNRDFILVGLEVVGLGGANDANYDMTLFHHSSAGWSYHAAAFVPGGTVIADWSDDMAPDDNIVNNENFAWKRAGLSVFINGADSEGYVMRFSNSVNRAVELGTCIITSILR